jgi:hypothetical protein
VVEDAGCGGVVLAPGGLVGEIAQKAGPHVVVACGVSVVKPGDPVLAGGCVLAQVEAVPGHGLGQRGGQRVQTPAGDGGVAAVFDQFGHGRQIGVEEQSGVLALLGGEAGEGLGGVLRQGQEVVVDGLAVTGLGERAGGAKCPVRSQR